MYCVSPKERNIWGGSIHQTESHFLNGLNKELYSRKSPLWDDEMRSMLAKTIGKTIPASNDVAIKRRRDDDSYTSSTEIENFSVQDQPKKMKFID